MLRHTTFAMLCCVACQFDRSGGSTGTPDAGATADASPATDAATIDGPGATADAPMCGSVDLVCCSGDQCPGATSSTPLYCDNSSDTHWCRICGVVGQRCCPGNTCESSITLLCDTNADPAQCVACGNQGQPCCAGNSCSPGLQCQSHQCQ